jgi:hypothetical protein
MHHTLFPLLNPEVAEGDLPSAHTVEDEETAVAAANATRPFIVGPMVAAAIRVLPVSPSYQDTKTLPPSSTRWRATLYVVPQPDGVGWTLDQ